MTGHYQYHTRGRILHIERDSGIYFVTFRLADSLPIRVLKGLEQVAGRDSIAEAFEETVDVHLDQGYGQAFLGRPEIGRLLSDVLHYHRGTRYVLGPWCVMPNHVHVVIRPNDGLALSAIVHSWKSFSANRINRLLNRSGRLWQREYFDRLIRSNEHLRGVRDYIVRNPERAGMDDWLWVSGGDMEGLIAFGT